MWHLSLQVVSGVLHIDFHDKHVLGRAEPHTLLVGYKRTRVAWDLTSTTAHILVQLAQILQSLSPQPNTAGADAFAV